jgi:hypothetical protein
VRVRQKERAVKVREREEDRKKDEEGREEVRGAGVAWRRAREVNERSV